MSDWLGITRPGLVDRGATPQRVAASSDRPVEPPACLVVGFDHRPASEGALRRAAEFATLLRADLHVVHVIDIADVGPDPDAWDWEAQTSRCVEAEHRQASEMLTDFPGIWTYKTRRGQPSRVLTNLAKEKQALMIVVGARRTGVASPITGWFGRSVANQLVHRSDQIPVLVVRP